MKPLLLKIVVLSLISTVLFFIADSPISAQNASLNFQLIDNLNWGNGLIKATQVTETYGFDETADTVTVHYQFDQVGFSPLPPMLAIAYQYGFPITFNQPIVNTGHLTEIGPLMGVANTDNYEVRISGLKKYIYETRVLQHNPAPITLVEELENEIDKILNVGHLAPALFLTNVPGSGPNTRGHMYWYNPGDTLAFFSELKSVLKPEKNQSIDSYLQTERTIYPPETIKSLPFKIGKQRLASMYSTQLLDNWYNYYVYFRTHGDPKIWNLYGLSKYYEAMGQVPNQTVLNQATTIVNQEYNYRDWATLYWQFPHWPEYNAVHSANQIFSGLVGYIRLAILAKDSQAEQLGWGLLARMATLRFAMGKYTQFEFDTDQFIIDPDICKITNQNCNPRPDWWAKIVSNGNHWLWPIDENNWNSEFGWWAQLTTQKWVSPVDNVRQIHKLDNQGVITWEWFGWGMATGTYNGGPEYGIADGQNKSKWWQSKHGAYLLPFVDLTPELGRFLQDYLKAESAAYIDRVEENLTNWSMAYAQPLAGREQGYSLPIDSYSIFMAKTWILNETPDKLEDFIDYSWLELGDYFYLHKLSETIKAYRGWCWSLDGVTCSDSSGPEPWGDLNQDQAIDFADYSLFLPSFHSIYSLFDFNKLVSWFGSLINHAN